MQRETNAQRRDAVLTGGSMHNPASPTALATIALVAICLSSAAGLAIDRPAGPIWNQSDAKAKCPQVCGEG